MRYQNNAMEVTQIKLSPIFVVYMKQNSGPVATWETWGRCIFIFHLEFVFWSLAPVWRSSRHNQTRRPPIKV